MKAPTEDLLIRLWDTLANKGIGGLLKPSQIRREGRARTEVMVERRLRLAAAEREIASLASEPLFLPSPEAQHTLIGENRETEIVIEPEDQRDEPRRLLRQVAAETELTNAVRKEINVSKAILNAESELADDPQHPPDRNIDDDWLFRWRDAAGHTSVEELQHLWGRVLAGELKSPGRTSLRTLEFLRNLSQNEAQSIERLAQLVVGPYVFRDNAVLELAGINLDFLLNMQSLGIISGVEGLGLSATLKSTKPNAFINALMSGNRCIVVNHPDASKELVLPIYKVTPTGIEVLRLASYEPKPEIMRYIGEHVCKQGFHVELARYSRVDETTVKLLEREEICSGIETPPASEAAPAEPVV